VSVAVVEQGYFSKRDAALYLGVSLSTIKRAIRRGDLPYVLIGSRPLVRIERQALDDWAHRGPTK